MNSCTRSPEALPKSPPDIPGLFRGAGQLFYLHNVTETCFEHVEQVPNFYRNAWPSFIVFIVFENILLYILKKPTVRLNDSITSLSHGLIQECGRLVFRGGESAAYIFTYNNWRVVDLAWDSPWTWYLTLLAVDFCYYWVHRASHEIHIFWAQHQVHHSSEDFNISVGLRQSILQGWCSFIFYLPMALFVPPSHFVAHQQFNLLYQVWIHTKTIKTLGPLEYILNTPQHHRVHHGCNIYCLDKNYGGLFIIWDRLFNTFASEREKEEIVYGLVFNEPSFNPLYLQVFYNQYVVKKFKAMKGFKNKLYTLIKGPSWVPGSPWTGFEKDKLDVSIKFDATKWPGSWLFKHKTVHYHQSSINESGNCCLGTATLGQIKSRPVYDVKISFGGNLYVGIHFVANLIGFQHLVDTYSSKNPMVALVFIAYLILSLTSIGMILDNRPKAMSFEVTRCVVFLLYTFIHKNFTDDSRLSWVIRIFFCKSLLFWCLQYWKISKAKPS